MASFDPIAVFSQLLGGYLRLPFVQKIVFPLVFVGSVAAIVLVSKWASRPDYVTLFSNLEAVDSAGVVERLKAQNIAYEIRGDGRTIAISPPEMVHELRISLAAEGLPKRGTIGFEIFDTNSIGLTSFVEKIKYLRAKQGELERTISSIDAIASVRVHITEPEKTIYTKQASEPTASVMIKLRAGGDLGKKQIKGIMNLVAGSVEGLKPENVSIVDTLGNLLSPSDDERSDEFGGEATRIQYQREIEKGYVQRIEQMLSKVVGAGKVIARVTADLDYSSNERQEESFDPGGQVIRSERVVNEGSGGAAARGGVPGVISNLTNDPKLLAPQDGSRDGVAGSRSESVKNYEVSRAVVKSTSPRGMLKRLSVAVLVDGTYDEVPVAAGATADAAAATAPKRIFKPLTSEVLSQIDEVVKSAVGLDLARGDTLRVENVQFAQVQDEVAKALESKATQDYVFLAVSWSGILLFTVMFFFFLVRPLVAQITTPVESEVNLERLLPTGLQDLERELEVERAKSKKAALPETDEGIDLEHLEQLMGENSKLVQENPRQAALLIRYWLGEG